MFAVVFAHPNGLIDVLGFAADADAAADMVDVCAHDFVCKADGEDRATNRFVPPEYSGAYVVTESTTHVEIRRKTTKTVESGGWFGSKTVEEDDASVGWITASAIDGESLRNESCWNPDADVRMKAPTLRRAKPIQRPAQPWMSELTARISRKVKDE